MRCRPIFLRRDDVSTQHQRIERVGVDATAAGPDVAGKGRIAKTTTFSHPRKQLRLSFRWRAHCPFSASETAASIIDAHKLYGARLEPSLRSALEWP